MAIAQRLKDKHQKGHFAIHLNPKNNVCFQNQNLPEE
jgi:hypothetical protein